MADVNIPIPPEVASHIRERLKVMREVEARKEPVNEYFQNEGIPYDDDITEEEESYFKQYSLEGDFIYPTGNTIQRLRSGMYRPVSTERGLAYMRIDFQTSEIIRYEDSISSLIMDEFDRFWKLRDKYEARGESHKRGFLLWGPPGGGKTSLSMTICSDFIKQNDGVVMVFDPAIVMGITTLRKIEPDRKILLLFEDIDSILEQYGENHILSILDGEVKMTNTVVVATTNYPERLPDRIRNRPSRFDRMAEIQNPNYDQRYIYFEQKNTTKLSKKNLEKYAKDTEEFSFAHLKELLTATEVYEYAYEETLERLRAMQRSQDNSNEYTERIRKSAQARGSSVGFGLTATSGRTR